MHFSKSGRATMKCKICSSNSNSLGEAEILGKYTVQYFRCISCGFIQTEDPYWLNEAYSNVINLSDVGLVDRNIRLARITKVLSYFLFDANQQFLDYAGGYGLFTRLMRDAGFDFRHYDSSCENLFARGFEADPANPVRYEALTAFEVFEHLVDPMDKIREMLTFSSNILFTTELVPASTPSPNNWWYYGTEHGQHISFYTLEALSVIAQKFSLRLYSNRRNLHFLTSKRFPYLLFRLLSSQKLIAFLHVFFTRKSLLLDDHLYTKSNFR